MVREVWIEMYDRWEREMQGVLELGVEEEDFEEISFFED
jgi:hypothetical protein